MLSKDHVNLCNPSQHAYTRVGHLLIRYHLLKHCFYASFLLLRFCLIRYLGPCIWIFQCLSAYYGAVYGMQVVGNWLSCPWHWAPERRKLHHTHYCANVCSRKSTGIRYKSNKDISDIDSLFTTTEVLTAQVSTVYSKIQRCKRFGGHNFPTWKKKNLPC